MLPRPKPKTPVAPVRSTASYLNSFLPPTTPSPLDAQLMAQTTTAIPRPSTVPSPDAVMRAGMAPTSAPTARVNFAPPAPKTEQPGMDWWGMAGDALRAGISAVGASQPLPERQVNPELIRMQQTLADRATQGLSPADRVSLLRQQQQALASDVQRYDAALGGGGSAAAYAAGLGGVSARSADMGLQIEGLNRQRQMENEANYLNALRESQAASDAQYANLYNNTAQANNMYAGALQANLAQIGDRMSYSQTFGPGTAYSRLAGGLARSSAATRQFVDSPVTSLR